MGCVRIRRGKVCRCVCVCANLCESNRVAQRLCECVGGGGEGECGELEGAKRTSVHVNELKVSAANYSPASLLVWQRGHSLLMV